MSHLCGSLPSSAGADSQSPTTGPGWRGWSNTPRTPNSSTSPVPPTGPTSPTPMASPVSSAEPWSGPERRRWLRSPGGTNSPGDRGERVGVASSGKEGDRDLAGSGGVARRVGGGNNVGRTSGLRIRSTGAAYCDHGASCGAEDHRCPAAVSEGVGETARWGTVPKFHVVPILGRRAPFGYRLMRAELSPPLSNPSPDWEALAGWLPPRACSPVVVFNLAIKLHSRV